MGRVSEDSCRLLAARFHPQTAASPMFNQAFAYKKIASVKDANSCFP